MLGNRLKKVSRMLRVGIRRMGVRGPKEIYYVAPEANWSIDWDGRYITNAVSQQFNQSAQLTADPRWLVGQIVHYGSLWAFLGSLKGTHMKHNTNVVTIFHGDPKDKRFDFAEPIQKFLDNQEKVARLVVSNRIMQKRFQGLGVPSEKISRIPLGVDLSVFRPGSVEERAKMRHGLGIPEDAFCIGSFHKDGDGFEEGLSPKLIKGPDILVELLGKLNAEHKIHVLLTAPARGYVSKGLGELGVPFTHHVLDNYPDLVNYYHALDAYVVPSREEGGPKGVLEALACGIPLVSTKMGMAADVVKHMENGLLAEIEDVDGLASSLAHLIEHSEDAEKFAANGLETIKAYDWQKIAQRYYKDVYEELLEN